MDVTPGGETLVVFHRATRHWTGQSFRGSKMEFVTHDGPIADNTVMLIDRSLGAVKAEWGALGAECAGRRH